MVAVPVVDLPLEARPLGEQGLIPWGEPVDQPDESLPEPLRARARARQGLFHEEPV
jgi:hypothetical protein